MPDPDEVVEDGIIKALEHLNSVRDSNVEDVIQQYRTRVQHGYAKYGVTTDRDDLSLEQWLQHAKEEAMDFVVYLNRIQRKLKLERLELETLVAEMNLAKPRTPRAQPTLFADVDAAMKVDTSGY